MGGSINTTYSKDDLLGIFRQQDQNGNGLREVKDLILGDLGPGSGGGWSRSGDDGAGGAGAEVCWEKDGGLKPVSLEEMVEEEREVCFLFFAYPRILNTSRSRVTWSCFMQLYEDKYVLGM